MAAGNDTELWPLCTTDDNGDGFMDYYKNTACLILDDLSGFDLDTAAYLAISLILNNPLRTCLVILLITILITRHIQNRKLPPGPWSWPVVGHVSYLLTNPHFTLSHLRDVYGDVYQLRCGRQRVVVLSSMEAILEGLELLGEHTALRPDFESYHALYSGHNRQMGVATGDVTVGDSCMAKKRFLMDAVDAYCSNAANIEDKVSSEIVETINQLSDLDTPFDPALILDLACLNVSLNLTFSQRFSPAGRMAREILTTYECRSRQLGFNGTDFLPLLKAFTTDEPVQVLQQRTECLTSCYRRFLNLHKDSYDPANLRDFTDQLLLFVDRGEDSGALQNEDIDYLLLDTGGCGFQETAVTLTWILGYVALHQDVQATVHAELDSIVGRDRLPCLDDQPYLPLTMAMICEVQRLSTVRPFLLPHRTASTVTIQGFEVPDDSVVLFNTWGMHRDPRYWPNPSQFLPTRFLQEDGSLEIPDHFLPYGAGLRQCPGESLAEVQLFLFVSSLLHQLRFLPADSSMTLEGVYDHLLRPKPFLITATERDSSFS